jgi:hypothetical protein
MNKYFSFHIVGFEGLIKDLLKKSDSEIKIIDSQNGLVIYESSKGIENIKNLRFLSNSFELIDYTKQDDVSIDNYINQLLLGVNSNLNNVFIPKKNKTFRVVNFINGEIVSIDNKSQISVESFIINNSNLTLERGLPDSEFWIVKRDGGIYLFGHRITYHKEFSKNLERGELRPDLCNLLCQLSEPNKNDVFLDPFSGSHAISNERKKICGYKEVIFGDIRDDIFRLDATNMKTKIQDQSITKIVTDPPWGEYQKDDSLVDLYSKTFDEFKRVLANSGIIVILTSATKLMLDILKANENNFKLIGCYNILVNGKKASVYKILKTK